MMPERHDPLVDTEQILVVPRPLLLPSQGLQGFHPGGVDAYAGRILRHGEFRPRAAVEEDPTLKQIIPYLIIRHGERIFLFQRSGKGGESRLHGRVSIGVGGHIVREDTAGADDLLRAGLSRELTEELIIAGSWTARPVGVLNDDETPVGRVHFGVVYVVETARPDVRVREEDRLSGRLAGAEEVLAARPGMEGWSQLILDAADPFAL
ncbi:MAG: phosphoesterase [Armatimonadetes bacterium]|nr:phosphoesterase [Armatimonadota bacterium]